MAALLAGSLLCGCSRNDQEQLAVAPPVGVASPVTNAEGAVPTAPVVRADHPCQLLTDAEVDAAFRGAATGKRDASLDKYGITTCMWTTPTDRFVVQILTTGSGSVADELRSRASGSVDPMMQGAMERVRFETVAGVGDEAMAIVERADASRGILSDTAVLVMQRGERRAVLFTGRSLAGGDRASALTSLETLGRSVAKRL
jgi:hypothetical protein